MSNLSFNLIQARHRRLIKIVIFWSLLLFCLGSAAWAGIELYRMSYVIPASLVPELQARAVKVQYFLIGFNLFVACTVVVAYKPGRRS